MIESPLNYTGGKYKLLEQIVPLFPERSERFVDLFCGGCNVGINAKADKIFFNDSNGELLHIYKTFKKRGYQSVLTSITNIIKKYGLSNAAVYGYDYYGCNGSAGLAEYNKGRFLKLRDDLNSRQKHDDYYYIMLYVVIVYAFNNQIRFNSKGEYNLPVGKRDFNANMKQKLMFFIQKLQTIDCDFTNRDFRNMELDWLRNDFVYADPPYLITTAGYNESNGWTTKDEKDLLSYLDGLNDKGISFALSNVFESKGNKNNILIDWCNQRGYNVHHLKYSYSNANYHRKKKEAKTDEVLVVNY